VEVVGVAVDELVVVFGEEYSAHRFPVFGKGMEEAEKQ